MSREGDDYMLYDVFNGNASAQQIASQIGGDLVKDLPQILMLEV